VQPEALAVAPAVRHPAVVSRLALTAFPPGADARAAVAAELRAAAGRPVVLQALAAARLPG